MEQMTPEHESEFNEILSDIKTGAFMHLLLIVLCRHPQELTLALKSFIKSKN